MKKRVKCSSIAKQLEHEKRIARYDILINILRFTPAESAVLRLSEIEQAN